MKKEMCGNLVAVLLGAATLFGAQCEGIQVIKLTDINQELLQEYFLGKMEDVVLEFPEGVKLPLNLSVWGEFLSVESDESTLHTVSVLKTCYIRCMGDNFLFSTDLETWKEFSEFFKGQLSFWIDLNADQPKVGLSVELNQKEVV